MFFFLIYEYINPISSVESVRQCEKQAFIMEKNEKDIMNAPSIVSTLPVTVRLEVPFRFSPQSLNRFVARCMCHRQM